MQTPCPQCHQKDDLIHKYLKLIKLLKAKCQKSAKSFTKNNTLPSDTLYETSLENSESLSSKIQANLMKSNLNPQKMSVQEAKNCQLKLGLMIIGHRVKKSLLKQSFYDIKHHISHQQQSNTCEILEKQINLTSGSIQSFIEETLTQVKSLQQTSEIHQIKLLHQQIFHLQTQNDQLTKKITHIQKQLFDSQKRFLKETEKKRESLETFGQEIRQKTEMIIEFQYTIKQYENVLGRKLERPTGNMLDEDLEDIRVNCHRLESVNQKLNNGVKMLENTVDKLSKEVLTLKLCNSQLKEQNEAVKQKIFELSHQLEEQDQTSSIYKKMLKKLNQKLEFIKLKQKQIQSFLKASSSHSQSCKIQSLYQSSQPMQIMKSKIVSTKNTDLSKDQNHKEDVNKISIRELQAQQKIEEIFGFLFNIREESYNIQNDHIFDDDQKELLNSHKEIFLSHFKEQSFSKIQKQSIKKDINIDESHFMKQTNQVFYFKNNNSQKNSNKNLQDDSVLCAFQPQTQKKLQQLPLNNTNNMKLIQLQIQKSKLIEKISQLKNLHMHIRNVVLNLMKSIDLMSVSRPETSSILDVVFEFFEYSEDQKAAIFKEKKKKFWGLL